MVQIMSAVDTNAAPLVFRPLSSDFLVSRIQSNLIYLLYMPDAREGELELSLF
jgi:hypothetical protein